MRCGLTNLEKRKTRADLTEAYKIMHYWEGSNIATQVPQSQYGEQNYRTRIQAL